MQCIEILVEGCGNGFLNTWPSILVGFECSGTTPLRTVNSEIKYTHIVLTGLHQLGLECLI